jgi:hypothetical protein
MDIQPRARVRRTVEPAPLPARNVAKVPSQPPSPLPDRGYDIGYGKPPKHSQFQEGQSGNKKGRPKGAKGLKTMVRKILTEKVTVRTGAGPKRMTRMEAMIHKITEKAFGGDLRALQSLVQLYQTSVPDEPMRSAVMQAPIADQDSHDLAILAAFRQSVRDEVDDE